MKKIYCIVLSLLLAFVVIPLNVASAQSADVAVIPANGTALEPTTYTSGSYTYSVSNAKATITDFNSSVSGAITIPSTLGSFPVTSIGASAFSWCPGLTSITIPDSVTSIGGGAFYRCIGLQSVTIGKGVKSIGSYAFEYCTKLSQIEYNAEAVTDLTTSSNVFYNAGTAGSGINVSFGDSVKTIPAYLFYTNNSSASSNDNTYFANVTNVTIGNSVTNIGENAFKRCLSILVKCYSDSYAKQYAIANDLPYEVLHAHSYTEDVITPASCTTPGVITYTCSCGDTYTKDIDALGHLWSEWEIVAEPTQSEGLQRRVCQRVGCGLVDEQVISPVITVENYTLTIKNAADITSIRIAKGNYSTSYGIKNAAILTLSQSVIEKNLNDGDFVYELPDGGIYSVWCKYANGTQKIYSAIDATHMAQTVNANGVKVTVNNLYGVKDMYIAKGTYTSYRDIKSDENYFSITSAKFGSAHNYTYAAPTPGEYTLLVRYNDSAREDTVIYFNCEVIYPTLETDGRQITIGNLDGIKVVRIAPGTYNTMSEIKGASGAVGYSASSIAKLLDGDGKLNVLKNATEEGTTYTVAVVYNNLYQEIHHITLTKKIPTYTVNGDSITFTNLDGLSMIRFAPGEYATSAEIKKASGVRTIKSDAIQDDSIEISKLSGKYTFLVQYYENSQSIYVIDF